jgi:hypothetical protein
MRALRTSGSVGRAPGNRCLYPEPDTGERGSFVVCVTLSCSPVQVKRSVRCQRHGEKTNAEWSELHGQLF